MKPHETFLPPFPHHCPFGRRPAAALARPPSCYNHAMTSSSALAAHVDAAATMETRRVWLPSRPMTFAQFLDQYGENDDVELIDGVPVEKMATQLEREKLFVWLLTLMNLYVAERGLGLILGARTAVEIHDFRGRLPDLLFVRAERLDIVEQKAIHGAPDLVIELISPGDRPSDIIALETDYRAIGVAEVWFVDQQKRRVRVLRRNTDGDYAESEQDAGTLASASVKGFTLDVAHLWADPRPAVRPLLRALLGE